MNNPNVYTTKELANYSGISERTFYRRVKELQREGRFRKTSKGYGYSKREVTILTYELEFDIPDFEPVADRLL